MTTEAPTKPACCVKSGRGRRMYLCDECGVLCMDAIISPSQAKFMYTQKRHAWCVGPQGEGKTFIGVFSMLVHAADQEKTYDPISGQPMAIRWAFVRDTHTNIKRISVPAIRRNYPSIFKFYDDYHLARAPGLEVDLFGMDRADDLTKIQGGEYDGIWIEEPAPIIAQGPSGPIVNAGMSREVFTVCATRMRGGKSRKRLQITMNPADRSHWTFYEREVNPEWELTTEVVHLRPGENPHISTADRDAVKSAFADRPDLYKRYVLGLESEIYPGVRVTPEYNADTHRSPVELKPQVGAESHLWFDGGLNPTCVLVQIMPSSQIRLIDCVSLANAGMKQLIETKLIPLLRTPKWERIRQFRALGDQSLKNREQSDSEHSGSKIIEELLAPWLRGNVYEGGVQDWDLRREAMKTILGGLIEGVGRLMVNPITTPGEPWHRVHAALAGGYCYKVSNGTVLRDKPDKNVHSHVGDPIGHALAKLYGIPSINLDPTYDQSRQQKRAAGYSVGVYIPGQQGR